jgi:hypothetical protein
MECAIVKIRSRGHSRFLRLTEDIGPVESDDEIINDEIAGALIAYCGLDTLAMVELLKVLRT